MELQKCPNCGGSPAVHHYKRKKYYIECDGDCWTQTKKYFSLAEAMLAWNKLQKSVPLTEEAEPNDL